MAKTKKGKKGLKVVEEPVVVPALADMDNETVLLHLENRHRQECKIEKYMSRHAVPSWISGYRVFHERLHKIAAPGQHDHIHEEEGASE